MRTKLLGGMVIFVFGSGCAAMHAQTVANMKANGDPRAPCYEACGPSGIACMKECDNKHPFAGTVLQGVRGGGGGGGGGGGVDGSQPAGPPAGTAEAPAAPNGVTAEQVAMLTAAALQDAARKKAQASTSTSTSSPSTGSSSASTGSRSSSSSSSSSQNRSSAPSSSTSCTPACSAAQKCVVYLEGSKQCAPNGQCWTVDRTHAECK